MEVGFWPGRVPAFLRVSGEEEEEEEEELVGSQPASHTRKRGDPLRACIRGVTGGVVGGVVVVVTYWLFGLFGECGREASLPKEVR